MTLATLTLILVLASQGVQTDTRVVRDEECGVEVELAASWSLHPTSTLRGGVLVKLYSPADPPTTRFTLIHAPQSLAGGDLAVRARQLGAQLGTEIPLQQATLAGLKADWIQYQSGGFRTVEYGLNRESVLQVFQLCAPVTEWEDPAGKRRLDELSHQWNAYCTPLPNELAEGVSTFTNLLYLGEDRGEEEYEKGVRFCAEAYLKSVAPEDDVALAHPRLYQSPSYRVVAFCKVPAVLHNLRRRLGEEAFFSAWMRVFQEIRDGDTAYESFRSIFEEESGEDLTAFFEGWFFRAGHARVAMHWKQESRDGKVELRVRLEQTQAGPVFEVDFDVAVTGKDGAVRWFPVSMRAKQLEESWSLDSPAAELTLNPDGTALVLEDQRD